MKYEQLIKAKTIEERIKKLNSLLGYLKSDHSIGNYGLVASIHYGVCQNEYPLSESDTKAITEYFEQKLQRLEKQFEEL